MNGRDALDGPERIGNFEPVGDLSWPSIEEAERQSGDGPAGRNPRVDHVALQDVGRFFLVLGPEVLQTLAPTDQGPQLVSDSQIGNRLVISFS